MLCCFCAIINLNTGFQCSAQHHILFYILHSEPTGLYSTVPQQATVSWTCSARLTDCVSQYWSNLSDNSHTVWGLEGEVRSYDLSVGPTGRRYPPHEGMLAVICHDTGSLDLHVFQQAFFT